MKKFLRWVLRHQKDASPLGDLARDFKANNIASYGFKTLDAIKEHLKKHDSSIEEKVLTTLSRAWEKYHNEKPPS